MDVKPNLYQKTAYLYDLDVRDIVKSDIPFYLEYAAKYPGNILELACGSGRVSIRLAQSGYDVYGIDLSDCMLEQLHMKLKNENEEVRKKIWVRKYDMSKFNLDQRFSLVIIPFRGFQALTSEESQRGCLKCIHKHLNDNGVFIVNVFRPLQRMDETWVYPETTQWEARDEKTGDKVVKKHRGVKIDVKGQIIYPEMIYQITKPNNETMEIRENLELKYYYYDQLKELLDSEGFIIKEEFGYYDKCDINQGNEMIFVCGKK